MTKQTNSAAATTNAAATTTPAANGAAPTNAATAAPAAEVKVKAPSKKSQATAIFMQEIANRDALAAAGTPMTNKAFRHIVLERCKTELGVTNASAATMYNTAKSELEVSRPDIGLGRDPKKEKPAKTEGATRGRPVGSKNKPKLDTTAVDTPAAEETAATGDAAATTEGAAAEGADAQAAGTAEATAV